MRAHPWRPFLKTWPIDGAELKSVKYVTAVSDKLPHGRIKVVMGMACMVSKNECICRSRHSGKAASKRACLGTQS